MHNNHECVQLFLIDDAVAVCYALISLLLMHFLFLVGIISFQPVFLTKAQRQQLALQLQEEEVAGQKKRCGIEIIKH
jgi:hypothetical protein